MKKMFIKYKILVNGLNPIGIYTLDGFTMKKGTFEERMFDMKYNQDNKRKRLLILYQQVIETNKALVFYLKKYS